jgi:hypothetical protein
MTIETPGGTDERYLRRVPYEIAGLAALLAVPAGLLVDPATGAFFLAGGLFSALGFLWLKQSLTRLLVRGRKGARRSGVLLYALRLVLICAVFSLIILFYPKKILAFVAGFSAIVPVTLIEAVRALLGAKKWKD